MAFGAVAAASALVLAGCAAAEEEATPDTSTDTSTETETETETSVENLVMWVDTDLAASLEGVVADFEADTGVTIEIVTKEFGNIRDEAITAIPTGEGPDIMAGAHDWTGQLVSAGVIAPIELGAIRDDFVENSIAAFSYDGALYGMPFAVENIALVCNSELVPTAPTTWDEVVDNGVQIALNPDTGDPFHMYPLQTSFGATVFEQNEDGSYKPELGMDNEAGLEFAQWLYDEGSQVFNVNNGYDIVMEQITSGELACWITGPWAVASIRDALGEDGFNIYDIPSVGGQPAAPFLGARGLFVSAQTEDPLFVQKFITEYIGTAEVQNEIYAVGARIPAHKEALAAASGDKVTSGFGAAGVLAQPMPSIPEMNSVWSAWGSTQAALLQQAGDPEELWNKMNADIMAAING